MQNNIKISVLDIDHGDGVVLFRIKLRNEITETVTDFYNWKNGFKEFAEELISFPKSIKHVVKFEGGGFYQSFHLQAFCYEVNGHSAIHIKVDDTDEAPNTNKAEFYIKTVPASLNKLGQMLADWNPETEKEFVWNAEF